MSAELISESATIGRETVVKKKKKRYPFKRSEASKARLRETARRKYRENPQRQLESGRRYRAKPEAQAKHAIWLKKYYVEKADRLRERNTRYRTEGRKTAPWKALIRNARGRARTRGIDFDLTVAWAQDRYSGLCELTGIPFRADFNRKGPGPFACSIDRIEQSKGYTIANCRFILFCVNVMRGTMSDPEMFVVVKKLAGSQ